MSNVITVENLVKKYKEHTAVNGISFEVKEGELFAFLGENGAGKSTTINMLCTILEKTQGTVHIMGHELGKEDDAIRSAIGIVFQNSVLDNKLTVKDNLYTRGSYYGLSKKQIDERLEPFMESFELKEIWKRRYENLSGGQRRRVDIIRALINNPKILFLDEPTTGLDPKSRKIVWDYIDYLRKEKHMTIFLTTHYMEETKDADYVVILDKGSIIAKGTPAQLKSAHGASRLVWYVAEDKKWEALMEGFRFTYDCDHYNIYFAEDEENYNTQARITDFIISHKDVITDYEVFKGSMDDVFLNLTGREMA